MQSKPLFLAASVSIGVLILVGCSRTDATDATPPNSGTGATGMARFPGGGSELTGPPKFGPDYHSNPGGAPNWALGKPMGNGFRSLTADQAGGMGTGLQGFNDVGAAGTTGAITDTHHAERGDQSEAGGGSNMAAGG